MYIFASKASNLDNWNKNEEKMLFLCDSNIVVKYLQLLRRSQSHKEQVIIIHRLLQVHTTG